MTTLFELQEKIAAALNSTEETQVEIISLQPPLTTAQRLAIYRHSFTAALTHTLGEIYQVCRQLVGEEFFHATAKIYIGQTPSHSPDISDYGDSFSLFLQDFPPAQSLPYLADVAILEWAWHSALHGEDYSPLDITLLTNIAEDDYSELIFKLPPDSSLVSSAYPIQRIWEFHQENYQGESTIDLNSGEVKLLVWRQAMNMRIDVLLPQEWLLLNAIQSGFTVEALYEHPQLIAEQVDIAVLLGEFVQKGWINGFTVSCQNQDNL